jgi:hypothetical protein
MNTSFNTDKTRPQLRTDQGGEMESCRGMQVKLQRHLPGASSDREGCFALTNIVRLPEHPGPVSVETGGCSGSPGTQQ